MKQVTHSQFLIAYNAAYFSRKHIEDNCSHPTELPTDNVKYYLTFDELAGFGITNDGELIAFHSLYKGRGPYLIQCAISYGARTLDCFAGYLSNFYYRYGFTEYKREPNWTAGGPDVVYMERAS